MFERKRRKIYCQSLYLGFDIDPYQGTFFCTKTNRECLAYSKDKQLDIQIFTRCPSNHQAKNIEHLIEVNKDVETQFFGEPLE